MKKIFAMAALGAGMIAAPTVAQAQNAAPGGLHIGVIGGYEGLDVDAEDGSATASADNAVYGITAGYDLSLGSAFVGVEGEISTSDGTTSFPDSFSGAREGLETNGQYYIGARRFRRDAGHHRLRQGRLHRARHHRLHRERIAVRSR